MTENDLRLKVAGTINGWLGSSRGSPGHREILDTYNGYRPLARGYRVKESDAYCATTVSAAYIKAGIAEWTGTECGCNEFINAAKGRGIWVEDDGHVPGIGDTVVYDWQDSGQGDNVGYADHIGIVAEVSPFGDSFTVTEGNMSGGKVGQRTLKVDGKNIRGFICPDFDAIAGALTPPEPERAPERFNTMDEIRRWAPWALETAVWMVAHGTIRGNGAPADEDEYPTDMDLSRDMLRILVIIDREKST